MMLEVTKNLSFTLSSNNIFLEIFRVKAWIFLRETSILVFCRISNVFFYLSKNNLMQNC